MELDYERTLAADKWKDDIQLKGKFENLEFNNVKFENRENKQVEKNEKIEENEKKEYIEKIENIEKKENIEYKENFENKECIEKIGNFDENKENIQKNENKKDVEKNEDEENQDDEINGMKHDDYQQLSEDSNHEEGEDDVILKLKKKHKNVKKWGEMQAAEVKPQENVKNSNANMSIDAQKIKDIMAKIQIKPPEWAAS
jgi:hypothetical protein